MQRRTIPLEEFTAGIENAGAGVEQDIAVGQQGCGPIRDVQSAAELWSRRPGAGYSVVDRVVGRSTRVEHSAVGAQDAGSHFTG